MASTICRERAGSPPAEPDDGPLYRYCPARTRVPLVLCRSARMAAAPAPSTASSTRTIHRPVCRLRRGAGRTPVGGAEPVQGAGPGPAGEPSRRIPGSGLPGRIRPGRGRRHRSRPGRRVIPRREVRRLRSRCPGAGRLAPRSGRAVRRHRLAVACLVAGDGLGGRSRVACRGRFTVLGAGGRHRADGIHASRAEVAGGPARSRRPGRRRGWPARCGQRGGLVARDRGTGRRRQLGQGLGDHPGGGAGVRPVGWLTLQQGGDHRAERAGRRGRGRVLVDDGRHGGDCAAPLLERPVPFDCGEQGGAERPQVGGGRGVLAADALRCGEARRAHHHAGLGKPGVAGDGGDAEVGQHGPVVPAEQHVARLDVPVHHPGGVRHVQRGQQLATHLGRPVRRDGARGRQHLVQRLGRTSCMTIHGRPASSATS